MIINMDPIPDYSEQDDGCKLYQIEYGDQFIAMRDKDNWFVVIAKITKDSIEPYPLAISDHPSVRVIGEYKGVITIDGR